MCHMARNSSELYEEDLSKNAFFSLFSAFFFRFFYFILGKNGGVSL